MRDRAAVVYQQDQATGKLNPFPFPNYDTPPEYTAGGGGLISTLDDYLTFARMLLNKGELNGKRYIKRETFELMTTNHLTPEQRNASWHLIDSDSRLLGRAQGTLDWLGTEVSEAFVSCLGSS